ncbi:lasso peptide biosynthesis PqqD family chaperone [Goodfellowiella coeruleoviolacea]|uniref:Coenzyme PQQ synthesis protein D (PqqD) n=1 Tax=Goodfellowiella coeruleoviolacea TaxID=334858 RepID=A0AAE3GFC8_9PSEU|nr:lasso peptide biosynthesis PqqD family chaperone [Goodfellowiella coeruleoviolacea]MCP2166320.1 Coenzyme PQQ synthesis protein D (PqqD) [Goodfellowiella coeruleoviolacea]
MPLRLHPDVTITDTADGTVLLHGRTGRYYQLNPTGAAVLHRLVAGEEPDRIAHRLAEHHRIDPDQAHRDVTAVLTQLLAATLVVRS